MNDEKKMKDLRSSVSSVNILLTCITIALLLVEFEVLRHMILSCCVILLNTVVLVFDGILKDSKGMALHGSLHVIWFLNVIIYLLLLNMK